MIVWIYKYLFPGSLLRIPALKSPKIAAPVRLWTPLRASGAGRPRVVSLIWDSASEVPRRRPPPPCAYCFTYWMTLHTPLHLRRKGVFPPRPAKLKVAELQPLLENRILTWSLPGSTRFTWQKGATSSLDFPHRHAFLEQAPVLASFLGPV